MKENKQQAFSILYDRYWLSSVKRSLHKLVDQNDAEEVVQNVFVSIWRLRDKIDLKGQFVHYLNAALRYEILRFLSNRLKKSSHLHFEDVLPTHVPFHDGDMLRLELQELQSGIDTIIDGLPEKCRLIFLMSRDEGMSAKQIANKLDISHRTVETQLSKAIRILKNAIHRLNILLLL
ncbi:sigma-70 family RNA polymerase sigma factor [Sphingobacterium sp. MYb388]|uniref:sigma-70 family RNA polymerase sigma factor n=1 Tax=Sphingobacterium sp. MYb388 TaxID=2745437 RepID=UPI00309C1B8A